MQTRSIGTGRLIIRQGDIVSLDADAIVNAANSHLAGGGGVDGAIHRAAGADKLQAACRRIIAALGPLPTGEAVITPGFALPAGHIIHTVGPIWRGGTEDEPKLLRDAYANCLELAREHDIETIAFPAIALSVLKDGLEANLVKEACMVLHGKAAFATWSAAAQDILQGE